MSKIKDFIMDVEVMKREGKTAAEIAESTGFPISYIEDIIKNLKEITRRWRNIISISYLKSVNIPPYCVS